MLLICLIIKLIMIIIKLKVFVMAKIIPSGSAERPQDSSRVSSKHKDSMTALKKRGQSFIQSRLPSLHPKKPGFFKKKIVVLSTGSKTGHVVNKTKHIFHKMKKSA